MKTRTVIIICESVSFKYDSHLRNVTVTGPATVLGRYCDIVTIVIVYKTPPWRDRVC